MKTETSNKQDEALSASAIRDYLTRLVSYPIVQFYRIEAKMWRELYQKQRGGKAYNEMQRELAETRRKLFLLTMSPLDFFANAEDSHRDRERQHDADQPNNQP